MKTPLNTIPGMNPALRNTETSMTVGHPNESEAMNTKLGFRKSLSFSSLIAVTGTLVLSLGLAACQPQNGANSPTADLTAAPGAGTGVPPAGAPTGPTGRGTGDSGGGNGKDGLFLEAYSFNPFDRPEWQTHMGPVITNLQKIEPTGESMMMVIIAAKSKRWYSIEGALDQLTNEQIGLGFMQDPTQQLARQSEREIWFDKTKFESGPDKAQGLKLCSDPATREVCLSRARAMGLVHEALLSLYVMQFSNYGELCKKFSDDTSYCDVFDKLKEPRLDPKPKRALNDKDYANIRSMTGWLVDQGANVQTQAELRGEFLRNGFDSRMYFSYEQHRGMPEKDQSPKEIVLTREQIVRSLTEATITGRTPSTCRVGKGEVAFFDRCPTTFKVVEMGNGKQALEMTVSVPKVYGSNQVTVYRMLREIDSIPETYTLSRNSLPGANGQGYSIGFGHMLADGEKPAVGTDVYGTYLLVSQDTLTVSGVWLTADRITKVTQQGSIPNSNVDIVMYEYASPSNETRGDVQIVHGTIEENKKNVVSPSRGSSGLFYFRR